MKIDETLTLERAEHAARSLLSEAAKGGTVRLDLSRLEHTQPGAAPRLTNTFRSIAHDARAFDVTVPSEPSGFNPRLQPLLNAGMGLPIARHASTISTRRKKQTGPLRKQLADAPPAYGDGRLIIFNLSRHSEFVRRSETAVRQMLAAWTKNDAPPESRRLSTSSFSKVATLVSESIWNVQDHSDKYPLPGELAVTSAIGVQWRPSTRFSELVPEGFKGEDRSTIYFDRVLQGERQVLGFIEIIVNDDGVGFAARHSQQGSIYSTSTDPADERSIFAEALTAGGTVKLRSQDCLVDKQPGYGSALIAEAINQTSGFASIRSGRWLAYLDGATKQSSDFEFEDDWRTYIPGTTLQISVPVFADSVTEPHPPAQQEMFS